MAEDRSKGPEQVSNSAVPSDVEHPAPRNVEADYNYNNASGGPDLQVDAEVRSAPDGSSRLLIDPMQNILIGSILIRKYLGIHSVVTMIEWHELYGLPIMKRPDGQWMTSITAIDEWITHASELENVMRPTSRGNSKRADIALLKAQRRVDRLKAQEAELHASEHGPGQD